MTLSPSLAGAIPILFVRDVPAAAAFYRDKLGFVIDFLNGTPWGGCDFHVRDPDETSSPSSSTRRTAGTLEHRHDI